MSEKTLLRVLLWWATLLSLCQAALLLLFFTTMGQPSSELSIPHERTTMFTYKASAAVEPNCTLTWYAVYSKDLPMDEGQFGDLSIKKDGYFFVCLRITLISSNSDVHVDEVSLEEVKETGAETLLTGWINDQTLSTGLLCKTERLTIGSALRVQIKTKHPESVRINDSQSLTSLDLLYIPILRQ